MTKLWHKQILFLIILCGIFFIGGRGLRKIFLQEQFEHTVAIRVSSPQTEADYDLVATIEALTYKFEQEGYAIKVAYAGNLYPKNMRSTGINIYLRAQDIFYDMRMDEKATHIFYMPRYNGLYLSELKNYTKYLTSQQIAEETALKPFVDAPVEFLPTFPVPHDRLEPRYAYDVLYITEFENYQIDDRLRRQFTVRLYNGKAFGQLTKEERALELAKAKIVVYDMVISDRNDADYVPFAVYDILSYGRPVALYQKGNWAEKLKDMAVLAENSDEMTDNLIRLLQMPDSEREKHWSVIRNKLRTLNSLKNEYNV